MPARRNRTTAQHSIAAAEQVHEQLSLFGLDQCIEMVRANAGLTPSQRRNREEAFCSASQVCALDSFNDITFLHAGLCQTSLPHSEPERPHEVWHRTNGRFHLLVEPGSIIDKATGKPRNVGVPYGTRARLIMLYLNRHGVQGKRVHLGRSMSNWMTRLGIKVTGGKNGSIGMVKQQTLRIGRARFSLQFENLENGSLGISDTQISDKLHLWVTDEETPWVEEIELTDKFHEHLREHAVPLADAAISYLSGSSLQLDLYAWAAHRLPRLNTPLRLNWQQVASIFSAAGEPRKVASRIRDAMGAVKTVYPDMRIEDSRHGLLLHPSKPPVPRTLVRTGKPDLLRIK